MQTTTRSAKAAELLAARRARMTKLRRRCAASVLSTFVLAFGVLTIDTPTTTTTTTTSAVVSTTSSDTSSSSSAEELPAVSTAQS